MRFSLALVSAFFFLFSFSPSGLAQEETPPASDECEIGALCTDIGEGVRPGERNFEVNDPPGDFTASFLSLGFIALVVGTYFFVALTGRSFSRIFRFGRKA